VCLCTGKVKHAGFIFSQGLLDFEVMTRRLFRTFATALLMWVSGTASAIPEDGQVDLALALAIDVSYSVDSFEHRMQMEGFGAAMQSPEVLAAIRKGKHQRIAVTVYQWSDEFNQRILVPWRIIATEEDTKKLGEYLAIGRRDVSEGGTAISASLVYGSTLFNTAPNADRKVIDLATDGRNNIGRPAHEARDFVVGLGITINGLAVSNEWKQLPGYLEKPPLAEKMALLRSQRPSGLRRLRQAGILQPLPGLKPSGRGRLPSAE
jgi:hypothetical protein